MPWRHLRRGVADWKRLPLEDSNGTSITTVFIGRFGFFGREETTEPNARQGFLIFGREKKACLERRLGLFDALQL
mgnify:CR=1 FL=1